MQKKKAKNIALAALFLALGMVLPLFSMQIKEIGDTLLPMHLPVLLCGFLLGGRWGFTVGLLLPLLRSVVFARPVMYPNALWMALELATYGLVAGVLYKRSQKTPKDRYAILLCAMLAGRIVWGAAKSLLLGLGGKAFTISAFFAEGFLDAIPGIILQLILIPLILDIVEKRERTREEMT